MLKENNVKNKGFGKIAFLSNYYTFQAKYTDLNIQQTFNKHCG